MRGQYVQHAFLIAASKISGLLGSLFFVYLMSPGDYGQYVIFLSVVSYLGVFNGLNFNQAYGRYIYESTKDINQRYFGGNIFLIIALSFIVTSTLSFMLIIKLFALDISLIDFVALLVISFGISIEVILIQDCVKKNALTVGIRYFLIRNIGYFLITVVLIRLGSSLSLIFQLEAVITLIGMCALFIHLNLAIKLKSLKYVLNYSMSYSLPLLPYSLALIILSQFDRLLINKFYGSEITGYYSYIYNFGILLSFMFSAYMNFVNNEFYRICDSRDNETEFKNHQRSILYKFLLVCAVSAVLVTYLLGLLLTDEYLRVVPYFGIVVSAILLLSIWQIWARVLGYYKKTKVIGTVSFISAISGALVLYALLAFKSAFHYGYWVTLLSYAILAIFGLLMVSKFNRGYVMPFKGDLKWIIIFILLNILSVYWNILGPLMLIIFILVLVSKKAHYLKF